MKKTSTLRKTFSSIFSIILVIVLLGLGVSIFTGLRKESPQISNIVLGVDGIGGESSELVRTDDAVSLSFKINDDGIVESDFDSVYPYSDITLIKDEFDNVFVKIPKFYSKFTQNEDGTTKLQISKESENGFSTLFIDGKGNELPYILVGAYESSGDSTRLYSKPDVMPTTGLTIEQTRVASMSNGKNYQQYDYLTMMIVNQLFMVEFATVDSQKVFSGYTSAQSMGLTGLTDDIEAVSGFVDNGAFKYRGIENLYGNVWTFIDGILFVETEMYLCLDSTCYTSDISTISENPDYTFMSARRDSGESHYKSLYTFSEISALAYPSFKGTGAGFGDYSVASRKVTTEAEDGTALTVVKYGEIMSYGGVFGYGGRAGIWCVYTERAVDYTDVYYGSRLVYKPVDTFVQA